MPKKKVSRLIVSGRRLKSGKANIEFRSKPVFIRVPEIKEPVVDILVNKAPLF